jgi:dTDP-4-dehydrorhamnose reductase
VKILVTGAAGLIGHHIARRWSGDHEVLALKHGDLDITDHENVNRYVADVKPSLIVNCAVIQVDESEENPKKAQAVNVDGARVLAAAANEAGAEIIHFSTQYVFEGEPIGRAPYTLNDEARAVNVYGKTKLEGELAVRDACARSYIIRTSWVYGSGKNSFLCTVADDLRAETRVRAVVDNWSSTTYVADLIDRIGQILANHRYGIFHVVNRGTCSYYDFAIEAGCRVGLNQDRLEALIEQVKETETNRSAARPRYTPLRCLLSEELGLPPMRHWREALADYVGS